MLIDESTQATEPECLIPLVLGAKQVIIAINVFIHKNSILKCDKMLNSYSESCPRLFLSVTIASLDLLLCARKRLVLGWLNLSLNALCF